MALVEDFDHIMQEYSAMQNGITSGYVRVEGEYNPREGTWKTYYAIPDSNKCYVELDNGCKQADIGLRYDLIPPSAAKAIARRLHLGALEYGEGDNWKGISPTEHINHAIAHIYDCLDGAALDGDEPSREHLINAIVRLIFAYTLKEDSSDRRCCCADCQ